MDTNGRQRTNKRRSEALKREIVAASYAPGASVAAVARHYDVNANQVFNWRRRFGSPDVAGRPLPPQVGPKLVPVAISAGPEVVAAASADADGAIEIDVADTYRVRVRGNFDCRLLRRVLDCLVRR